jgi:hypothetical protein
MVTKAFQRFDEIHGANVQIDTMNVETNGASDGGNAKVGKELRNLEGKKKLIMKRP